MSDRSEKVITNVIAWSVGIILTHWLWGAKWGEVAERIYFSVTAMLWTAWVLRKREEAR